MEKLRDSEANRLKLASAINQVFSPNITAVEDYFESSDEIQLQVYPNPFNSMTNVVFNLNESAQVELICYDILGRKVAELFNGFVQEGNHSVEFSGERLISGIYFVYF
ncbi:T9SS type A sorting domain-containing protein [Bacteroidota bacterium]